MAKSISLRDANQRFAQIIRSVEEKNETIVITRRGTAVAKISPMREGKRALTSAQQRTLDQLFKAAHKQKLSSGGWTFNRDEIYDD
jgi:prevent-host-death family protein